ncbi:hypothetical protein ABAC460_10600 [Asticcacaulis sp. AC460]|uniref:ABC transporter ATP-binding protein n=1 Tax=Asticcacaulis sp. AC460 TaxID=1282360 RepID=UPI0003C3E373|nr:ABC transporter ATP-binding protein [Asticcacaulis sp. AC460]ESQ90192.1 hypothetical protein ABAC460_10600 [Asticcacaulis sp. AC460]
MFWNRDNPTLTPDLPAKAAGALSIKGVSKRFTIEGKTKTVLDGIGLDIQPGEFVSIVGPSGCGKSTLLRLISGLDTDYDGDITLGGERITGPGLERGIVFQDHRLLPWLTIEDNIDLALIRRNLPRAERQQLIRAHLALVNLTGYERAFPHQLSGGMAQRAAIARGLVNEPGILLLDEPLGALDALTRLKVRTELERIWIKHRNTMIMVTHDVSEAVHLSNRVVVMASDPGRIARIVSIPLDYPRERSSALLLEIEEDILQSILSRPQGG